MSLRSIACAILLVPSFALAQSPDARGAQAPISPHAERPQLEQPQEPEAAKAIESVSPPTAVAEESVSSPAPQMGKIVMYRGSTIIGAAVACPIRYKGREIVELGRGKFAEWEVPPGRYILNNKTSSIEVTVEPGKTSYVRCSLKMGFFAGRADLQIVDEESFAERAHEFQQKQVAEGTLP